MVARCADDLRRVLIPLIFGSAILFPNLKSQAQAVEIGGGIGAFNYAGDLVNGYRFKHIEPGIFGFYKFNFSDVVSTRVSLGFGKISGSDADPIDPTAALRNASFSGKVTELALTFEYNFLDYKHDKSPIKWSPYVFGGFGFGRITGLDLEDYNKIQPVIPFGLGVKHLVGKKYSLGLELGARKTFFDLLDEVADGDISNKNFQYGNPSDNDWYYFVGISFSYIFYNIPCPFQYTPNESMMRSKIRAY